MRRLRSWFPLAGLSLGLVVAACDGAEQCASERESAPCSGCTLVASERGCPVWTCPPGCAPIVIEPDPDQSVPPDFGGGFDTSPQPSLPYRFVRIDDLGNAGDSADAGSDIDALVLTRASGEVFYANTVEAFEHGGGFDDVIDPTEALGAPDAFYTFPDVSRCALDGGYVSLGGLGGKLVVGFPVDIVSGDILEVLEVGGCWANEGPQGIPDPIEVSVSVSNDLDAPWVYLGSGEGPVIALYVPILPPMP